MRSRFPHGGEVLGAAPANPILAPVLSQDRGLSMSRQRELLDLQAIQRISGLVGYWKADPQYLFEDSAGTIPASTSGTGPIGQWPSVGNASSLGPVLNSTGNCESSLPFTKTDASGSVSTLALNTTNPISGTQDARLVITTAAANRPSVLLTGTPAGSNNIVGATYKFAFDYKVNSGTLTLVFLYNGATTQSASYALTGAGHFEADILCAGTVATPGGFYCGNTTCDVQLDNITVQQRTGIVGYQSTTANKPILRKTAATGVYWADSNTATSALNVALGDLGSACTVARASAEGVTFTENVSITSTYNIAPAFSFNSDVAIFNRALTDTEKALITRYMARAVPMLGSNLVTNGTFDTDAGWIKSSGVTIENGTAVLTNVASNSGVYTTSLPSQAGKYLLGKFDVVISAGTITHYNFNSGLITRSTSGSYSQVNVGHATTYATRQYAFSASAGTSATVDNMSSQEIL